MLTARIQHIRISPNNPKASPAERHMAILKSHIIEMATMDEQLRGLKQGLARLLSS